MITWRSVATAPLDAQFLFDVNELLYNSPYSWYVTCGFRSISESNRLWDEYKNGVVLKGPTGSILRNPDGSIKRGKRGARAAIGGLSAHNYGRAIDVVLDVDNLKPGLQPSWNTKMAGWLWLKLAVNRHPRLRSGWRYNDWPHIEQLNWRDYVAWRKTYEDNLIAVSNPSAYVGSGVPV